MSENPYKAPVSGLEAAATNTAGTLVDARTVDAGRGWEWIVEGFALFKKQPGTWILVLVVLLVCSIVISLVPVVGTLINMVIVQIFMGGLMLGCRALDGDGTLELSHLFAGFNQKTSDLVVLGVLALIGWIIAFIPALLIVGGGALMTMMHGGQLAALGALSMTFLLSLLLALALAVPVYMAIWFAPALIMFHDMKPLDAMKSSFFACLKNIVPFLLYGIILMVLCVVASIPFGLGFLVLGPVIVGSIYAGYRDIFTAT